MFDEIIVHLRKPNFTQKSSKQSDPQLPNSFYTNDKLIMNPSLNQLHQNFYIKIGQNMRDQESSIRFSHPLPQRQKNKNIREFRLSETRTNLLSSGINPQRNYVRAQEENQKTVVKKNLQKFQQMNIVIHEVKGLERDTKNQKTIKSSELMKKCSSELFNSHTKKILSSIGEKKLYDSKRRVKTEKQQCKSEIKVQKQTITLHDFEQIQKIGQGAYSEVFLVRHKVTGMIFALKIYKKEKVKKMKLEENIFREISIHLDMENPYITRLYQVFDDGFNIYLILEFLEEGSLWKKWKKQKIFHEQLVAKIIFDVCKAVLYLHEKDILHRDIKLENILLREVILDILQGVAKLGDFGCAVKSFCMRKSTLGSLNYLSPQQIGNRFYNKKIDIWSIGVVTYELLFGCSPFEDEIMYSLKNSIHNPILELVFPAEIPVSSGAKDFLVKMLEKNSNDRIDIEEAVKHPFFHQIQDQTQILQALDQLNQY